MPQWQGGNEPEYHFGAQLLAWLAPAPEGPVETVSVPEPGENATLGLENGMRARSAVVRQAQEARQAIEKHQPDRILTLGGDAWSILRRSPTSTNAMAGSSACFGSTPTLT